MDASWPEAGLRRKVSAPARPSVPTFISSLKEAPPDVSLLKTDELFLYIEHGVLPYRRAGAGMIVVCVDASGVQPFLGHLSSHPPVVDIVLTSREEIDRFIRRQFSEALSRHATDALFRAQPELSARRPVSRSLATAIALTILGLSIAAVLAPMPTLIAVLTLILIYTAASTGLKLLLLIAAWRRNPWPSETPSARTPIVTILVPFFRESKSVATLTAALERLEYPKSRLDVKYLVEENDPETWEALDRIDLPSFVEVIRIPRSQPQNKPKAMNFALPFARGELLAIFDAEDIPDQSQVRKAVDAIVTRQFTWHSARYWRDWVGLGGIVWESGG